MAKTLKIFNSIRNRDGVGLVEILISAFIVILVVAFTLRAFVGQKDAQNTQAQVTDVQQAASFTMQELTTAIRNAGYMVPAGTRAYRKKGGALGHDTLVIYRQNEANPANTDSTRYFLAYTGANADHPKLMRKLNALEAQVFAENIENVDFIEVGPIGTSGAKVLTATLTARTEKIDSHLNDYRRRTLSSDIVILNAK